MQIYHFYCNSLKLFMLLYPFSAFLGGKSTLILFSLFFVGKSFLTKTHKLETPLAISSFCFICDQIETRCISFFQEAVFPH